ncbi:MAG: hypothetical protein RLZZ227_1273 [Pseudomonadota bacterium]|jgi:hypothetical protein
MSQAALALFYLWSRSLVNLVLLRLRRLKQPKYLFGAVLALGYMYMVFINPHVMRAERAARRAAASGEAPAGPRDFSVFFSSAAALSLLLLFAILWLWPRKRSALTFSEAEIAWLFPGPVAHRTLVHYSLIRTQAALLFSAFFITLVTAGWTFIASPLWARFIGWWLLLSVFTLHVTASGFVITRLLNRGIAQWQRQLGVAGLVALLAWLLVAFDPNLRAPVRRDTASTELFMAYIQQQVGDGALYWVLLPLRALAAPLVAADVAGFLLALGPAVLVYALHYLWAVRSELQDREASLANAEKRAGIVAAMRKGNFNPGAAPKARRDPFVLSAQGTPVVAFLWKNLLSTREYLNWRTLVALALLMLAGNLLLDLPMVFTFLPTLLALILGAQTLFVGAQFARQDLRSDMDNADLMKTWPLQGWQIVLGEMLAPTLILTGILWLCLLQLGLGFNDPTEPRFPPQLRLAVGLSLALVLPFVCATQLLVANAAAVLFPAWMKSTVGQNQGLEVAGQRLLFVAAQWLVMMVALVPALILAVVVFIPASWLLGAFAAIPAAIVAALVLAGELAWGINWLGERFDAYDLSA